MNSQDGPPAQAPQVSPDGKWYWDGAQWRPFAVHQAVFPTWQSVGAGLPAEVPMPVQRIPTPPPQPQLRPMRTAAYPVAAPAVEPAEAPLWRRPGPSTGINKYLYGAGGVIGLLIVAVILNSMGTITFPWQQTAPAPPAAKAQPALSARSDSARADLLINQVLAPPLSAVGDSVTLVRESCPAGMTASCQDALIEVDNRVTALLPVIDRQAVPVCIAPQVAQFRADLVKLDGDAQLGIKGFKDNRAAEVKTGAGLVASLFAQVQADDTAMSAAAKGCDTQVVGP